MTPAQKALIRHRKRTQAIRMLCKAVDEMQRLPTELFSQHEVDIIRERFGMLMLTWLSGHGFEVHYER